MGLGIVLFIVAILLVVMIHESGHFIAAKAFGFKATQFFVGFGPTLWSVQRGETEYGVKAVPLGGFVKIVGMSPYEEVAPEDESRSYPNKPKWQRAIVLVAGSASHWVIAFVLLSFAALVIGFPQATTTVDTVKRSIDGVPTSAAALDLEPGDRILAIPGTDADTWDEISTYIRSHAGETVPFRIERGGEVRIEETALRAAILDGDGDAIELAAAPDELRSLQPGESISGYLGVSPTVESKTESFPGALATGGSLTWEVTRDSVVALPSVFEPVFDGRLWAALQGSGERELEEGTAIGLVGAGRMAGQTVARGQFLNFIGLIVGFAVFVGIMNLLPLPPLDGGHLAVVGWEALTGRRVDMRKLIPVAAAVISFFVLLFLAVLYLDLARPISVPL